MATRLESNLFSDLKAFEVGHTLDIELYPHDNPGHVDRAIIECVKIENGEKLFELTTFDYGDYEEDEYGDPIENDPTTKVSPLTDARQLVALIRNIGSFAY